MATLEHDVCDVHGASSLYIKTCSQSLYRVFPTEGIGESPTNQQFAHSVPTKSSFPRTKSQFNPIKIKNVIFSCSHCSCTIFGLISYSFETQIMLILILIDVQYSQNDFLTFKNFRIVKITPPHILTNW